MKDTKFKPKCPLTLQTEPLQKPLVLLRFATTPLDEAKKKPIEPAMAADESEQDDDGMADEQQQIGPNGYTLVELSKAQVQKLIDSGKLKVSESEGANEHATDDWSDDDERSKKRPWRKIQRIIRRQLVKYPKRYFKKIVHSIG
ncbi:uncharacterized protein LOC101451290 [Ceratitis capitata]|uniref:uncharacterized protein LOC101451290 n=1 Tax=Ceratitis capitata TaxID=7213 RepID=UPI000329C38B|nr:uncharacterized protein LOC101451290 [Ceratitis capitata]